MKNNMNNKNNNKNNNNKDTMLNVDVETSLTSNSNHGIINTSTKVHRVYHTQVQTMHEKVDSLYKTEGGLCGIVFEEYKLIFVSVAKVGSSEWKRFLARMMNLTVEKSTNYHKDIGFLKLESFPPEKVNEMMTSDEWTRAIFVREPKERILSAFLDKFVNQKTFFYKGCCKQMKKKEDLELCESKIGDNQEFTYFLKQSIHCPNGHWSLQSTIYCPRPYNSLPSTNLHDNMWHFINFVGYMQNAEEDAKRLLYLI